MLESPLIGQTLGNYTITALLGEGGMATVYRARQEPFARDVAIKVIEPRLTRQEEFVRRFEREARTIAALSHSHILKVFDYGRADGVLYFVMELLTGGSLAARIRQGPLPLEQVERVLEQVASALDYAHLKGIVHRDLKPQNVLFDEAGNAHLADFGIAKLLGETTILTAQGIAMGTPAYMAPEQWKDAGIDGRTDVYALGVMAYEMLAGSLPFQADTPFSLMNKHIFETPPPIGQARPDIPAGAEATLLTAMAKSSNDRFQTAGEFAAAFSGTLAGKTLSRSLSISSDAPATARVPFLGSARSGEQETPNRPRNWQRPTVLGVGAAAVMALVGLIALLATANGRAMDPFSLTIEPSETSLPIVAILPSPTGLPDPTATDTSLPPTTTPTFQPSMTATPSSTHAPSATATIAATATSNIETSVAATLNARDAATALAVAAFQTATANVTPSQTPVPPTATATATATITATSSETPTATPTASATSTSTATSTLTATWTPSATQTPSHTPTASQTETGSVSAAIRAESLNVRGGPGTSYSIIGGVTASTTLDVIGRNADASWIVVRYADKEGWIINNPELVQVAGDVQRLPVLQAAALPTRAPSTSVAAPAGISEPTSLPSEACGFSRLWPGSVATTLSDSGLIFAQGSLERHCTSASFGSFNTCSIPAGTALKMIYRTGDPVDPCGVWQVQIVGTDVTGVIWEFRAYSGQNPQYYLAPR